jgi:hypothetical protein
MNANELRIGNIVCPINRNTEVHLPQTLVSLKVMTIGVFDAQIIGSNEKAYAVAEWPTIPIHDLAGIPITEEWLLKAGFEKHLNGDYYRLKAELCIGAWSDKFSIYLPYYHLDTYTGGISVKYVHTLQNLYFTLTGTEIPFTA